MAEDGGTGGDEEAQLDAGSERVAVAGGAEEGKAEDAGMAGAEDAGMGEAEEKFDPECDAEGYEAAYGGEESTLDGEGGDGTLLGEDDS
jgi:hypothetical protein